MEEYTSIAIKILMVYLVINFAVITISTTDTFNDAGIGISGLTSDDTFGSLPEVDDSSTASSTDVAYPFGFFSTMYSFYDMVYGALFNLVFGWTALLGALIPSWLPGASLFKGIFLIIFGVIQGMAMLVLIMKIAGIIRGGS